MERHSMLYRFLTALLAMAAIAFPVGVPAHVHADNPTQWFGMYTWGAHWSQNNAADGSGGQVTARFDCQITITFAGTRATASGTAFYHSDDRQQTVDNVQTEKGTLTPSPVDPALLRVTLTPNQAFNNTPYRILLSPMPAITVVGGQEELQNGQVSGSTSQTLAENCETAHGQPYMLSEAQGTATGVGPNFHLQGVSQQNVTSSDGLIIGHVSTQWNLSTSPIQQSTATPGAAAATATPLPSPMPVTSVTPGSVPRCVINGFQTLYRCIEPSVLRLTTQLPDGTSILGSSFVVRSDATGTYLVTNKHVVDGATTATLLVSPPSGGRPYHPIAIALGPDSTGTTGDLAVVKLQPSALRPVPWGNSDLLQPGQQVAALGYGDAAELQGPPSYTQGTISQLNRTLACNGGGWIQHQAPLNSGNSGGPLLDEHGEVVGVNTLALSQLNACQDPNATSGANSLFFAIPSNAAQSTIATLIGTLQGAQTGQRASGNEIGAVQITSKLRRQGDHGFQLPVTWRVLAAKQARPFASKDGQISLSISDTPLGTHVPSATDLKQRARHVLQTFGPIRTTTVRTLTSGRGLPGTSIRARFIGKNYQVDVTWLIDRSDSTLFEVVRLIGTAATPRDVQESDIIVNTLHVLS